MARALLIIDPQKGWSHPVVDPILANIPNSARSFDGQVVICRFRNDTKSHFEEYMGWNRFNTEAELELMSGFEGLADVEFWRGGFDCLQADVLEYLDKNDINQLYLCGVFTDVSIILTALRAFDLGIEPFVVADLSGTLHGGDVHDAILKSLNNSIGAKHVVSSDSLPVRD